MPEHIIAILIPIIAIIMGVGSGMLALYLDFRRKSDTFKLYHAERMAAIEKGIELPPLPRELFAAERTREPPATRHRRSGLILLFLGLAVTGAMLGTDIPGYWWGLVPAAIGVAFLLSSYLEMREQKTSASQGLSPDGR